MNNFKKFLFGFAALIIICSLVFSASAFKNNQSKAYSYWRYDLNQEAGALSGFNYTKINEPGAPSCDDANEIPCVIRVDETITTQSDLDDYLSNHYNSDEEVMELAIHTKSEL